MKKLLIIALLVVGCDYAPTEHTHTDELGVCGLRSDYSNVDYQCFEDKTENSCIAIASTNDKLEFRYWGNEYTCAEICDSREDSYDDICWTMGDL